MLSWRRVSFILLFVVFFSRASFAEHTITFPDACASGPTVLIAAVGDVLLHQPLQDKAARWGFESLWSPALPFIKKADLAYANLEGPMAPGMMRDGKVYTDYPYFNYNPKLASALKNSGFEVVSTANNHALDRSSLGIDKTLNALDQAGLACTGTRAQNSKRSWVHYSNANGFKIAWLACTEMTNGNPDKHNQVLHCYGKSDRQLIIKTIGQLKTEVDAVIVTPHWGEEYEHSPNAAQKGFAHQVLNAGATAVIGSHPHVLQPMEKYVTNDGRSTFIMYSLGNFVSYQGGPPRRATVILFLGLTKTAQGTVINGVRFIPMYMQNRNGLANLQLTTMPSSSRDPAAYQAISTILPMGNAAYSTSFQTNPQCSASGG